MTHNLNAFGLIANGFVRILAAYVLFTVLTRLTSRPRIRHVLWLLFLAGAGTYWLILIAQGLIPFAPNDRSITSLPAVASSSTAEVTIPSTWHDPLKLAAGLLIWVYAGVVVVMLWRLARRGRFLRKAVERAQPVSPHLNSVFEKLSGGLGIPQCRILELPGLGSPGTAYTRTPVILIPEGLDLCLDGEQLIDVLYHELIHVRRLDFFWSILGEVVACLLFFHPVVWLALRNLGRERELACDSAVMELRHGRLTEYALCLTGLARRRVLGFQLEPSSHLISLNSFLARRIQALLSANPSPSRLRQGAAISGSLLAVFVFFVACLSLSLAFQFAGSLVTDDFPVPSNAPVSGQKLRNHHGRPRVLSVEAKVTPSTSLAPPRISAAPAEIKFLPADSGDHDVQIVSPPVESRASVGDQGTVWDETPSSKPGGSQIPWQRTVTRAAIDALGRVAQGRRDDGDSDDRSQQH